MPKSNKLAKNNRLPELFSQAKFTVADGLERVGQVDCAVVEAATFQKLWLDPNKAFALRRREEHLPGGALSLRTEYDDFAEVANGVWMPKEIARTVFVLPTSEFPREHHGKPFLQVTDRIKTIEANRDEHDEYLQFNPEQDAVVFDEQTGLAPLAF